MSVSVRAPNRPPASIRENSVSMHLSATASYSMGAAVVSEGQVKRENG